MKKMIKELTQKQLDKECKYAKLYTSGARHDITRKITDIVENIEKNLEARV